MLLQLNWLADEILLELLHYHHYPDQHLHLPYLLNQLAMVFLSLFPVHCLLLVQAKKNCHFQLCCNLKERTNI